MILDTDTFYYHAVNNVTIHYLQSETGGHLEDYSCKRCLHQKEKISQFCLLYYLYFGMKKEKFNKEAVNILI